MAGVRKMLKNCIFVVLIGQVSLLMQNQLFKSFANKIIPPSGHEIIDKGKFKTAYLFVEFQMIQKYWKDDKQGWVLERNL